MDPLHIDSRPDPTGRFTRVTFDPALATFTGIRLMRRTSTGETEVYPVPIAAGQHPAFSILFRRYDMVANAGAGTADYFAVGPRTPLVEATPDGGWTVKYGAIPATMSEGMAQHAALRATLTLRPSEDAGWVELDLHFPWPAEIPSTSPQYAWEPIVSFPRLHLEDAALGPYRLLNPGGLLHNAAQVKPGTSVVNEMPVQFTSLYYEGRNGGSGVNNVTGLMVMGTDELGHDKTLRFERVAGKAARLQTEIRAPMHLNAERAFVHPPAFALSGGDANGWGGARMKWRMRAFRIDGAVPEQPVDWHDVAALYRDWARTRTSTLFRKHPTGRTTQGPMDGMSPFSVICHYSLQGDADPGQDAQVAAWLEMHPIHLPGTADGPDIQDNPNPPLITVLEQVRDSLKLPGALLEAQIWGAENDGYYRYLAGWPPRTNIIRGDNGRFRRTMDALVARKIIPLLSTDPLLPNFNRRRFRGHLRRVGTSDTWETTIPAPFHPAVTAKLKPRVTTVSGGRNRVWELDTGHEEYREMAARRKRGPAGAFIHRLDALSAFHGLEQYALCPTPGVRSIYINKWLRRGTLDPGGALDHGFRLIEFMKHSWFFCFDRNHDHLAATGPYADVMGCGPWYVRRMEEMLKAAHAAGVQAYPSFSLNNEFQFPEALVPVFDEFYDHRSSSASVFNGDSRSVQLRGRTAARNTLGIPVLHFVYSQLLGQRGNVVQDDNINHPGYLEVRKAGTNGRPAEMLAPGLDEAIPDAVGWVRLAEAYFTRAFDRAATQYGLAPVGYPTAEGTYTYHRAVQDTANLRSRIFRFGAAGVLGERIGLPAAWYVGARDYNDDALAMGIRAAQMQMAFPAFFRKGYMLGQTQIVAGNRAIQAWRLKRRVFDDVAPLRADCEGKTGISDVISLRTDVTAANQTALQELEKPELTRLETDQVQHMVWQLRRADGAAETLYVFANVGNTPAANFQFRFTRGVEANAVLKGSTRRFDGGNPTGQVVAQGYPVVRGATLTAALPPRTFVTVHITPG
ncbi:MAG TPA: hypothetical protein VF006_05115 [Longimicrobium sp.]